MERDQDRISSVRETLMRERCDALVCAQPRHVLMLSGYWPLLGNAWAVATRDGRVLLVVPEDELELASAGWADAIYTFRAVSLHRLESVATAVREPLKKALDVAGTEVVGFEGDGSFEPSTYVSQFAYGAAGPGVLRFAAPHTRLVAADVWLERLRTRKTRAELQWIRAACALARRAFERAAPAIRPGRTEREVASTFEAAFAKEMPEDSRGRAFFYCMSGTNSAEAYRSYQRSRSRVIEPGDVVLVHCNSVLDGYWTDLTRTYVLGRSPELVHRLEALAAARASAIARIAPGVLARTIDSATRASLDAYGFDSEVRTPTGHGVGLAAIDHGEPPRLHPLSNDVLDSGMTCNIEPGLYRRGVYGLRHCDMVAVVPDGCEVLSAFQTEPDQLVLPT